MISSTEAARRVSLFGVPVDSDSARSVLQRMISLAVEGTRTTVYYVNAHVLNLAIEDSRFKAVLASGDIVLADGYGARLAAKWLANCRLERVAITDYIWDFAGLCADAGATVFIVAGQPGVADRAAGKLVGRYPALKVVGTHHGYLADPAVTRALLRDIRDASPDVVCVGMGSPIQEAWIAQHSTEIEAPLLFAVGAVMDYVSGEVKRSRPDWVSDAGLEWTGRLLAEPRRMWKRYLIGIPRFLLRVALERLRQKRLSTSR